MKLGVNIDHVATLRQARRTAYPDLAIAARAAEVGGADSITIHLREDRRHIQDTDVHQLRRTLEVPMNLEMAATHEMVSIACAVRPWACCIVPERRAELTTEGGLDVVGCYEQLAPLCAHLARAGMEVSLFIDPDDAQIDAAARLGVAAIELHTGTYADATDATQQARQLALLEAGAARAAAAGLIVNAGHGLHYENVAAIAAIPSIRDLNIGHSIVARALFVGMISAVEEMKLAMRKAAR
ncbi:MAG: pyridoxine 5'-phosphate synthase [Gammaproteobacteria bacterium]|nr:pyridoxine 5'-phosphate synthase [Gammaproteobacteria bacterium]